MIGGPVWRYPRELRNAAEHAYEDARHGELRSAIATALADLVRAAYGS